MKKNKILLLLIIILSVATIGLKIYIEYCQKLNKPVTLSNDEIKIISVIAENNKFNPDVISVKKDENIKIKFLNKDLIPHNIVIPYLNDYLIYEVDLSKAKNNDEREKIVRSAIELIKRRVAMFSKGTPIIKMIGNNQIKISFIDVSKEKEITNKIRKIPVLEFKEEMNDEEKKKASDQFYNYQKNDISIPEGEFVTLETYKTTKLNSQYIKSASLYTESRLQDKNPVEWSIKLVFDKQGKIFLNEIFSRNFGKRIAICLDGVPISMPIVTGGIENSEILITGDFTLQEADKIVGLINAGILPFSLKLIEKNGPIRTRTIKNGETDTIEFIPKINGEFEFFCSLSRHNKEEMKGVLKVE